jgi:NADH-quinone oxidoreductase subunit N
MNARGPDLYTLLPELILAVGAMALLIFGAIRGEGRTNLISYLAVAVIAASAYFSFIGPDAKAFHGAFVVDAFVRFIKAAILWSSAACLLMAQRFFADEKKARFEIPVLMLLATCGMSLMVSAQSFIALYMGLEFQSLALYVLAASDRDNLRSTEAGLKYFVLGSLSSGMMLYGIGLIYGFTGSVDFAAVAHVVKAGGLSIGLIFGLVFLIAGLAFKISAVPFHMWTPDVYEGAPTPITAYFASSAKIAAFALLLRALMTPFPDAIHQWRQIIIFISILSMALGAVAAIGQTNIKRLMAYSSIGHMGYALLGLAAGTALGIRGMMFYLVFYAVTNLGVFACIQAMRRNGKPVEDIYDLAGLARTNPQLAFAFAAMMLSLSGLPPLAGILAKAYIFLAAIQAHLYALAIFGVLTSVIAAYYYLRIVKVMYFDEPAPAFDRDIGWATTLVATVGTAFSVLFVINAGTLIAAADHAAKVFFR